MDRIRFSASISGRPRFIASIGGYTGMERLKLREDDTATIKFTLVEGSASDLAGATWTLTANDQDGAQVFQQKTIDVSNLAASGYVTAELTATHLADAKDGMDVELKATVGTDVMTVYTGVWDIVADVA